MDGLVRFATAARCAVCASPLEAPTAGCVCPGCWAEVELGAASTVSIEPGLPLVACGVYDGRLREIIHAFKYRGHQALAGPLAGRMRAAACAALDDADYVVPVPLHWRRQLVRGFNQADLLARHLGPPVGRVLRRARATQAQRLLAAAARRHNVHAAFAPCWTGPVGRVRHAVVALGARLLSPHVEAPDVADRVVVLVDDVCTTGSTLAACARVLRLAGAREVRAVTVARVESGRRA